MLLKVLLLEDSLADAELLKVELQHGGIVADYERVYDQAGFTEALERFGPDIILADFNLPGFSGMAALEIRNQQQADTPFIFVSGSLGDERAVATLRDGATDFVLKDRMARLPSAVTRALEEARQRRENDRVNAQLNAERKFMRATLNTAQALITVIDSAGNIMYLNPIAERVLGQPFAAMRGKPFWEIFSTPDSLDATRLHIRSALEWKSPLPKRSWPMALPTGRTIVWTSGVLSDDGENDRLVLSGIDVTDQERAQEHAFYLGHFDSVTGLPNRKHFLEQLGHYCKARDAHVETVLVVMMLGVGRVGEINDSYGDIVLKDILMALVSRMRVWQVQTELLARVSDNSFALAFEVGRGVEIDVLAPHILDQLRAPIQAADRQWVLPVHGGVALYPDDATEPYMLLQCAEAALHCAEADSRNSFAFYTPLLSDRARERLQIESELREALRREDQLVVHYQPQVDIASGKVVGLEALIRWQHPRLTWLPPNHFIPIAEVCGLMPELGNWVLRSVC
ncbi:MAG: EAL domain-containing protein [Rhodocyclaceae bacterium]